MNITELVNWRYSTKKFNPNKKISSENLQQIKDLLRFSPSSTNLQPWHFIITDTENGKSKIIKGMQEFNKFNEEKVLNASHSIVFCVKTDIDKTYMQHLLATENEAGRYPNNEIKERVFWVRNAFADMHRYDLKDFNHWLEKQVFLNIGHFLLGVAVLKIDAVVMEGANLKIIDQEFNLREKGLTSVAVVSLGYRSEEDFNSPEKNPKARFSENEIFTIL